MIYGVLFGHELTAQVGKGVGELHVAGVGDGEGVGGVEVLGCVVEAEDGAEDGCDLFFGGVAVAGDYLLDDGRFVLGVAEVATHGGGNGHSLGAAELEHRLHVLAEEGSLDGEVVRMEGVDDADGGVEDAADTVFDVGDVAEVEDIHSKYFGCAFVGIEEAVAEDAGTGVDAKDEHSGRRF